MKIKAVCAILPRDGAILGVSRKEDLTAWGLPGGKVEDKDESPEQALAREMREETGFVIEPKKLITIYDGEEDDGYEGAVRTFFVSPSAVLREGRKIDERGLCLWIGWPELLRGPFAEYNANARGALYDRIPEFWIQKNGSGSLRRAKEEGMRWYEMYLSERSAFEFGYGFQAVPDSRLTWGSALAECDSAPVTETCWWARRLRTKACLDKIEVKHGRIDWGDGEAEEGIGILWRPAKHPHWLPRNRLLWAFTSSNGKGVNPC